MFQWTPEKKETALDMAITGKFSSYQIADQEYVPRHYVRLLLKEEATFIEHEASLTPIPELTENSIIDLYEEGQELPKIANYLGVSEGQVRRVVLLWNKALEGLDEEDAVTRCPVVAGVAHLALLRSEHPDRMYEEDVAALGEYAGQGLPMRGRTIEPYLP